MNLLLLSQVLLGASVVSLLALVWQQHADFITEFDWCPLARLVNWTLSTVYFVVTLTIGVTNWRHFTNK